MAVMLEDAVLQQRIANFMFKRLNEDPELLEIIQNLVQKKRTRLVISVHDLDRINRQFCNRIINSPLFYLTASEEGFKRLYNVLDANANERTSADSIVPLYKMRHTPKLGISGWLGSHTVTPRGLSSRLANRLVCVIGIVTRCSLVYPKLSRSVLVADASHQSLTYQHFDHSSLVSDAAILPRGRPQTDADGNPLRDEPALCGFRDFQRLTLQEMPENAPTGQLPRAVDILLEEDLVDCCKPGDRIRAWGVFRVVASREGVGGGGRGGGGFGISSSFVLCDHVEQLREETLSPKLSLSDIWAIREISEREDTFDLLASSIAPSICGHDLVKKGLLLQLLGGERKTLEGGMKLRGDIHILLIGDPSCGKSQLLRFMMHASPLALSTTGRGSSGVGLTAAVVSDKDSGERRLEAGAMVLGDGGLVCIDEFDKMNYEDRVAIHEVMEQQTVTISKAGIQTMLNARTSVLAAANPLYGCFDPDASLKSQISLPDSLLTRFDLIYIIRDAQTSTEDRRICAQVLQQLQKFREQDQIAGGGAGAPGGAAAAAALTEHASAEQTGVVIQPTGPAVLSAITGGGEPNVPATSADIWSTSIVVGSSEGRGQRTRTQRVLSVEFLRKYIWYARTARKAPVLSDEAVECIADFYANLRQLCASGGGASGGGSQRSSTSHAVPTARTLEACVRLATAHARLKLKDFVDADDAREVQALLTYTLLGELPPGFGKSGPRETRKKAATAAPPAPERALEAQPEKTVTRARKRNRPGDDASATTPVRGPAGKKRPRAGEAFSSTRGSAQRAGLSPRVPAGSSLRTAVGDLDETQSQGSVETQDSVESLPIGSITAKRLKILKAVLSASLQTSRARGAAPAGEAAVPIATLLDRANELLSAEGKASFSQPEFNAGIKKLQLENKVMVVNNEVWFI